MPEIHLSKTGKKNKGLFASVVDIIDFDLDKYNWSINAETGYAYRFLPIVRICVYLHEEVALRSLGKRPMGYEVDHIDQNKRNNRRSNLRYIPKYKQRWNQRIRSDNKSGITGVTWDSKNKKWKSQIGHDGEVFPLGRYKDMEDAIKARLKAEEQIRGNFHKG